MIYHIVKWYWIIHIIKSIVCDSLGFNYICFFQLQNTKTAHTYISRFSISRQGKLPPATYPQSSIFAADRNKRRRVKILVYTVAHKFLQHHVSTAPRSSRFEVNNVKNKAVKILVYIIVHEFWPFCSFLR